VRSAADSLPASAEDQIPNSRPASPEDGAAQNNAPDSDTLTLRALVTTKEAGVIIGKGGKNVADLREQTGVKAGVSKVVQGVNERVLSVSGTVEDVAKVRTWLSSSAPLVISLSCVPCYAPMLRARIHLLAWICPCVYAINH
jgi:hypothetical protein